MKILSLDPGNHCGIAMRYSTGLLDATMLYEDPPAVYNIIHTRPELLVVETFNTEGNISRDGLYTVRLIGGILAEASRLSIPIVEHAPDIRVRYLKEAKRNLDALRKSGRYTEHELDAVAHLLAYEDRSLQPGMEVVHRTHPDIAFSTRRSTGRGNVHQGGKRIQTLRTLLED